MYHQVLIFTNPTFCPHSAFMPFVWIWEQRVYFPYSINWLVLITEKKCVYCAVRTESLKVMQAGSLVLAVPSLKRLVAGLSPRRPGFDPRTVPCQTCDGPSGTGTCFSPSTAISPVSIISPVLSTRVHQHIAFTRRSNGRSLETVQKRIAVFEIMQRWL